MHIGPEQPHPPHEKFTRSLRWPPRQPHALRPPQYMIVLSPHGCGRIASPVGLNIGQITRVPMFRVPPSLYGWHPGCEVAPASVVPKLNTLFLMFTNLRNRAQQDRGPWTYEKWAVQILSRTHRALDPEEPHHAKTDGTLHLPLIQSVAAWTKTRVSSRNSRDVLLPHPRGRHVGRHPDLGLIWRFLLISSLFTPRHATCSEELSF